MIIDQLPEISSVEDTDELPIEHGTTTYKAPLSKIWNRLKAVFASSSSPLMDGTAAAGTSDLFSRADHVHPSDTSKQDAITVTGMLKSDGNTVSAATKGADYGARAFQVTLPAADWSNKELTVSNTYIQPYIYAIFVSADVASKAAYNAAGVYADDVTGYSQMTFHCTTTPATDLTVNLVRIASANSKTINL